MAQGVVVFGTAPLSFLLLLLLPLVSSRLDSVEVSSSGAAHQRAPCEDSEAACVGWAEEGECDANPNYMRASCRKSCGTCEGGEQTASVNDCEDAHPECGKWAEAGECQANPGYMLANCVNACNVCPPAPAFLSSSARRGMGGMAAAMARADCVNGHEECASWAAAGECAANPSFMITNCARACATCHLLDAAVRCRPMPGRAAALAARGHLNATFRRAADPSGPFAHLRPRVLSEDPWVVVFDAFTSPEEAAALIRRGAQQGFSESVDAGRRLKNGSFAAIKSSARTSETAWCTDPFCVDDPLVAAVTARIADVSRVPYANSEYLQVLRYVPGQYYVDHHDYIPGHLQMPCGPRLYTLFLYLSDVEEGGGTAFTRLKASGGVKQQQGTKVLTREEKEEEEEGGATLVVTPALGRAVLWPSVMDDDPFKKDPRTHHEAKPVLAGTKFAANAWLHMYDFKAPFKVGCTG